MGFGDLIQRAVSPDKVRRGCDKCPLDRSQYVPSKITPDSSLVVIGEAPGKKEVEQGVPFVGGAGEVLRRALREEGVDPDSVSYMNVVKCRPPKNATPSDKVLELCGRRNLRPELSQMTPRVILLVGSVPFRFFFPAKELEKSRGNFRRQDRFVFMPTFHPAFVLHRGGLDSSSGQAVFAAIRRDISKARRYIDGSLYSDREYTLVRTVEEAREWGARLCREPLLAWDIECTRLRAWHAGATLLTVAFSWAPHRAVCFPINHFEVKDENVRRACREAVQSVLAAESVNVLHNAKFDVPWVRQKLGWEVNGPIVCTMLMAYLLDENRRSYGLKQLSAMELEGYSDIVEGEFENQSLERLYYYNCEDADNTKQLFQVLKARMDRGFWRVHDELLVPASLTLAESERAGIRVDLDRVRQLQEELGGERDRLIREANQEMRAGTTVTSTKDLREHLFEKLNYPVVSTTAKGTPQVNADVLKSLYEDHGCELARKVLDIRALEKLVSTYLTPYPRLVEPDGRIHCSFMFTTTVTGRLSSADPNLQNVPRDPRIRNLFVARPGWKLVYGDLSNAEMRVAASLAREPTLMEAFRAGADIHKLTASQVNNIPMEEVTKDLRQKAKPVNFGFLYGQMAPGFIGYARSNYGITFSLQEAEEIRSRYFTAYAGLTSWYREVIEELYSGEEIRTVFGRARRFPGLRQMDRGQQMECERMAINTKVQSASSDLTLLVCLVQDEFMRRGMEARLLLTVHDSVLCEAPPDEVALVARLIYDRVSRFEGEFEWLKVPMEMDLEAGEKWASLEPLEPGKDF